MGYIRKNYAKQLSRIPVVPRPVEPPPQPPEGVTVTIPAAAEPRHHLAAYESLVFIDTNTTTIGLGAVSVTVALVSRVTTRGSIELIMQPLLSDNCFSPATTIRFPHF